jgi:putative transposon-encoded protein
MKNVKCKMKNYVTHFGASAHVSALIGFVGPEISIVVGCATHVSAQKRVED